MAGLILETPGLSVLHQARKFLAPSFLVRNHFRTDLVLPTLDLPVLIVYAEHDMTFDPGQAAKLHELAKDSRLVGFDAGHNDLPRPEQREAYLEAVRGLLTEAGVVGEE